MTSSEAITPFLSEADSLLSEEIRYKQLRLTAEGLFVDQQAEQELLEAFSSWSRTSGDATNTSAEKLEKRLFGDKKSKKLQYLLDGKSLLVGSLLPFTSPEQLKVTIPSFRGSLLDAHNYIHMKDPIFDETKDVSATLNARGFSVEIRSRKHPLTLDNTGLLKIAQAVQLSSSLSRRHPEVAAAARNIIPAFTQMWKKARVVQKLTRLLVPAAIPDAKHAWFLLSGDLVFVQGKDGAFLDVYGLRGKNLHQFLVNETEALRSQKKKFKTKSFRISPKGRSLGSIQFDGNGYYLDPACVRKFLERVTVSRDLPQKVPARFTMEHVISQLLEILEKSVWTDTVHVPRSFSENFPAGTNYRSKANWYFALSKKRSIVGIHDKNDRTPEDAKRGLVGISPQRTKQSPKKKES